MRQYSDQRPMRPIFRWLLALVLIALALAFGAEMVHAVRASNEAVALNTCSSRGRLVCEFSNWVSAAIPDAIEYPLELALRGVLVLLTIATASCLRP